MLDILSVLGIYPKEIEHAWEIAETVLEEQGLAKFMDEFEETVKSKIPEIRLSNATNDIIYTIFDVCKQIIERRHPGQKAGYYVNGYDSHFYPGLDPNSVGGWLENFGLTPEEKGELLEDYLSDDLYELVNKGLNLVVYNSKEECRQSYELAAFEEAENVSADSFCDYMENLYFGSTSYAEELFVVLSTGRIVTVQ